jgi:cytoskeleton protein RodZ
MNNSVGDKLKGSREKNAVSLSKLAQDLKISETFLTALEANKFEQLPGETYAIGFIRSYANRFDLDADSLIRSYKASHQVTVKPEQEFFDLEHPRSVSKLIPILSGIGISLLVVIIWALQSSPDPQPTLGGVAATTPELSPSVAPANGSSVAPADGLSAAPADGLSGAPDGNLTSGVNPEGAETGSSISSPENQNIVNQDNQLIAQEDVATQRIGNVEPTQQDTSPATIGGISSPGVAQPSANGAQAAANTAQPPANTTQPVAIGDQAAATVTQATPSAAAPAVQSNLPVTIRAKRRTWMRIESSAGRILYSSVIDEGIEFALEQGQVFSVSTRDAGAIEFFIGAEMIGRLGRDGEILANRSVNPSQLASQR